jgi:hypothetical protein
MSAPSIFLCFSCKRILNKLALTHEGCGHSFCRICYEKLCDDPPCCEQKSEFHDIKRALITSIQTYKQMCPSPECTETVALQKMEDHLNNHCNFSGECKDCGEFMNRSKLPIHTKSYCKERKVKCKWCFKEAKLKEIDEHEELWWLCIGSCANLREHPAVRNKILTKRKVIEIDNDEDQEEQDQEAEEAETNSDIIEVAEGFEPDGFVVPDEAVDRQTPKQIDRDYKKWRAQKKNNH